MDTTTTIIKKKTRPKPPVEQPGALRTKVNLELHTRQAQSLLSGRFATDTQNAIIGLFFFESRTGVIYNAAKDGDPYADWFLLRIEESIEKARAFIKEKSGLLRKAMEGLGAVKIGLTTSLEPTHAEIDFSSPYGYLGAYLLSDFDEFARLALTSSHCAIADRTMVYQQLASAARDIRDVYQLPTLWKRTGVTRDDVRQGRDASLTAAELMGVLPEEVLQMKKRARFAPKIGTGQ